MGKKTAPQTPFWKFSDLKVSWTIKPVPEGVKIDGPAVLVFYQSIDLKPR